MTRIWPRMTGALVGTLFAGLSYAALPAHPGVVNYVEGQATIAGQAITAKQAGSVDIQPGQELTTGAGKVEVLLTPGVFLRVGERSVLRLENAGLMDTRVDVVKGQALLEATQVNKESALRVDLAGATTTIEKAGLYKFDADHAKVSVFDGKAVVSENDQKVELKKGRFTQLSNTLKSEKFDRKQTDELYAWSNVRSRYLSEASYNSARTLVVNNYGWGGGWYFNPYFGSYSYLPGDGLFYNAFGYPFYSPLYLFRTPVIVTAPRGFYGGGRVGGPVFRRSVAPAFRAPMGRPMGGFRHR